MAAPAITARLTPVGGKKLLNGFPVTIAFALEPDVCLWEKNVKTPGYDGGEAIPISDMFNVKYHTSAPRVLIKITNGEFKCAFAENAYNRIVNHLLNKNGAITAHLPKGTTVSFYGFMKSFQPDAYEEGKQPEATVMFEITNWDDTNQVEEGPVVTPAAGT